MKKIKKLLAALMSVIICIAAVSVNVFADTSVVLKNTTWTMADYGTANKIISDIEWNNLYITASESKYVSFDGTYLKLQGAGSDSGRKVSFKATGPCTIEAEVTGGTVKDTGANRVLVVSDSKGNVIGKIEAPSSGNIGTVSYNGYGDEIFLYSENSGINIKYIKVTYNQENNRKGDVNGDGNVDSIDAALVLKHIAGIDSIGDNVSLSAANGNNDGNIDILDANWILNNVYEATSETTTIQTIDTSDGTKVKSYDELTAALSKSGAIVYVMNDIDMDDKIQLSKGNQTIIGVPDENGVLPVLNFENMVGSGKDITSTSSSDSDVGLRIRSANNVIKNLVIEKAKDNGIQIKGVEATGNTVENCIVRYNNDSGIQVTGGACGNTLKGIYSYRNCDVYTLGGNADGFAIKLSAGPVTTDDSSVMDANKNVCIDCYAWENSDDGWDSFDYPLEEQGDFTAEGGRWTYRNDYENCMCWNNGTAANCLGYTDYVNGLPLDEDLPFMRRFKTLKESQYNSFVSQYNDGSLCSRSASASTYYSKLDDIFGTIPVNPIKIDKTTTIESLNVSGILNYWGGNPNGFKLGSKDTQSDSERYMTNCIAFDHGANGFDKNNSGAKIWAENCISFGNGCNYYLQGYTAYKWTNVYGWDGSSGNNKPSAASGVTVAINGGAEKEETIREAASRLVGYAEENRVVYSNVFENVF